jgi:hypothetical protein
MRSTHEEMEQRLPHLQLLCMHARPCMPHLHAMHVRMQLHTMCSLMRM